MRKYYYCSGAEPKSKMAASAFLSYSSIQSNENITEFTRQVIENLKNVELKFELVNIIKGKNGISVNKDISKIETLWYDYTLNQFAWPMFSKKMKDIIVEYLRQYQKTEWIKCEVKAAEECRDYYIPVYLFEDKVLDENKTSYVDGTDLIIVPVFKSDLIKELDFFTLSHKNDLDPVFYVSDILKINFEKAGITGLYYDKIQIDTL